MKPKNEIKKIEPKLKNVRLTKSIKDRMCYNYRNAIKDQAKQEMEEIVKKECAGLGEPLYRMVVSEDLEKRMREMPKGFFEMRDWYVCSKDSAQWFFDGLSVHAALTEERPFPESRNLLHPKDEAFVEKYKEVMKKLDAIVMIAKQRRAVVDQKAEQFEAALESISSTTTLRRQWPEAVAFLPDHVLAQEREGVAVSNALVKTYTDLNKVLGLPIS